MNVAERCLCGCMDGEAKSRGKGDNVHQTVVCAQCSLERQPIAMSEKELLKWYATEYSHRDGQHGVTEDVRIARLRLGQLGSPLGRSLVDVGSSNGAFVAEAVIAGWDATGIDIAQYEGRLANERTYNDNFFDTHLPTEETDVVVMHDILEHFVNPVAALKEVHRIMRENGTLVIEVPAFGSRDATKHYRKTQHLWLWTEEQLYMLLKSQGFVPRTTSVPVPGKLRIDARRSPSSSRPTILMPPGIGDSLWVLTKLQAWMMREGVEMVDAYSLSINNGDGMGSRNRSDGFLRMFPFIHFAGYKEMKPDPKKPDNVWKESYLRNGKTWFPSYKGCGWYAAYNGVLRHGGSLEQADPDLACNWDLPRWRSLKERHAAEQQRDLYFVTSLSAGGMFKNWLVDMPPEQVAASCATLSEQREWAQVMLGSSWDSPLCDFLNDSAKHPVENLVGKTDIAQAVALLSKAQCVVGFPSGLTILAAALRVPTVILWSRYFNRRFWKNACPPAAYGNWYAALEVTEATPERVCDAVALARGEVFRGRNDYDGVNPMSLLFHEIQARKIEQRFTVTTEEQPADEPKKEEPKAVPAPVPVAVVTKDQTPLNVVCVWRKGWDVPNGAEYVERLAEGVRRNLRSPYKMTVLTDSVELLNSDGAFTVVPLKSDWMKWWAKVEIFRADLFPKGPTLYLDLDTIITGPLDGFLDQSKFPRGVYFLDDFYHPGNPETGVIFWTGIDTSAIHRTFDPQHLLPNDAMYISGRALQLWRGVVHADLQKRMPIVSYKVHIRGPKLMSPPNGTSIVCFHGHPRPHEVGLDYPAWVNTHWLAVKPRLMRPTASTAPRKEVSHAC